MIVYVEKTHGILTPVITHHQYQQSKEPQFFLTIRIMEFSLSSFNGTTCTIIIHCSCFYAKLYWSSFQNYQPLVWHIKFLVLFSATRHDSGDHWRKRRKSASKDKSTLALKPMGKVIRSRIQRVPVTPQNGPRSNKNLFFKFSVLKLTSWHHFLRHQPIRHQPYLMVSISLQMIVLLRNHKTVPLFSFQAISIS